MMAGLPVEARDKVIDQRTEEARIFNLCIAYRKSYGIIGFDTNPVGTWNYSRCLDSLELSDIALMVNALIKEKLNG